MSKNVKRNYIYNLFYQILTLIVPLITTPYLARILEADGVGTISYAESIVSYFVLFAALGVATYGQREISYIRDSVEDRSRVFWETQLFKIITTAVVSVLYILFALFAIDGDLSWLYVVYALQVVSVAVDIVWFFQGLEEFGKIVLRNVIVKLLTIVFVFTVVKTKDDLIYYVLCNAVANFVSAFAMWSYLPKYVKRIPIKGLKPFRNLKVILGLFIPTIAIQIYTVLDKTMIGLITQDTVQNGYYEEAIKIARMALTVVTALGTVMIPRIGYHFEKGETETVKEYMYRSYRFVWLLAIPLCLGLIMISENFVHWFLGEGFDGVIPLMKILSLLILAIGINTVTGNQYLIPTKREKPYTATVIIGAGVNFTFNLFLIYFFGSIGAAMASVLAETIIAIIQLVIVRKELSIWKIVRSSVKYWIAGGLMVAVLCFENAYFTSSILNTCIMIVSGAAVYFAVLLISRDGFLLAQIKNVLKKFKKEKIKVENNDEEV